MKKATKRKVKVVAVGVAAALAGAYLLYRKAPASRRRQAKAWVVKARKDVAREVKKMKRVSPAEYGRIIDQAMRRYESLKNVSPAEVVNAARDLKGEWKHILAHAQKAVKVVKPKKAKKRSAPKRRRAR